MKKFLQLLVSCLVLSVFVAGCTAEVDEAQEIDSAEFATGTLRQGVHAGCGVDVYNRWADDLLGGMAANTWLANFGTSACSYKLQVEMKEGAVSYFSPVYPSHTLQPTNPAIWPPSPNRKVVTLFPDVQSPCHMRNWLKMNNQWTFDSWTLCF